MEIVVGNNSLFNEENKTSYLKFTEAGEYSLVEKLVALEIDLYSTTALDGNQNRSCVWPLREELCESMLKFCLELMSSMEKNGKFRIEFGRVERNKLIRRLLDCLLYVLNCGDGSLLPPVDFLIRILQLISVLMDLHDRCANQIGIIDNFEELGIELTIVNTLFSIDLHFIIGMGMQRKDLVEEVFANILLCVKSIEDFSKQENPRINLFIKLVINSLLDEVLIRSLWNTPSLRYLIDDTLQCLINCTTISTLFRKELSINFGRVIKLLRLPFDFATYKIFGEYLLTYIGILSLFYRLLGHYLMNYIELIQLVDLDCLAEITTLLLSCNDLLSESLILDPLVLIHSLSIHEHCSALFSPHHSRFFISRIKSLISSSNHETTVKTNIISIVRKWMELYANHFTNNVNITNLVEEILSQNLPLTIFSQLCTSDPSLTLTINHFLSWMISSMNSNDIFQIHKFSEFLALEVLLPFTSGALHSQTITQTILNKLLQEHRLIPTLTENKILSLIEDKSLTVDDNLKTLIHQTEKEQAKFTSMLKALPPNEKQLLKITEGNMFIKKLQ